MAGEKCENTEESETAHTIPWARGKPSLIIGIQRRKPSIRTPFAARFHHSPLSTEGRHVPAPVGGCRRPHRSRSTTALAESTCTTSTTSTNLHRHYARDASSTSAP